MPLSGVVADSYDNFLTRLNNALQPSTRSSTRPQRPACIHLCVTLRTVEHKSKFIADLQECVEEVLEEGNDGALTGNAAIYGMSGSMPPGPINELLKCYTDVILKA